MTWQRTKITYKRKRDKMQFDTSLVPEKYEGIIGIDEAGWGPVAGPLSVAAVYIPPEVDVPHYIKDSKKMTPAKMADAYNYITDNFVFYHLFAHASSFGVLGAGTIRNNCFKTVDAGVRSQLDVRPYTIIDGVIYPLDHRHGKAVIKGDGSVPACSAASIVAKYLRDSFMIRISDTYPEYGFEKHMGYLTTKHKDALNKFGPTPEHRRNIKLIRDLEK